MTPINKSNISYFAYTNEDILLKPIRGIVLDFHGLGGTEMAAGNSSFAVRCADKGVLYVFPYYGPWSWMNDVAVRTVDEIIDALFDKYSFVDNFPIISTGGSMGGLSALIYSRYAKRTPVACATNCPVCDLIFHYTERPDLPRTIYHALAHYETDFEEAKKSISPLHQVDHMPDIPYFIVHCTADKAVNKKKHSDVFVEQMIATNHTIEYVADEGREHCDLSPEARAKYEQFIFLQMGMLRIE